MYFLDGTRFEGDFYTFSAGEQGRELTECVTSALGEYIDADSNRERRRFILRSSWKTATDWGTRRLYFV